jgi:hypothetical protein
VTTEADVLNGIAAAVGVGGCGLTGCPWAVAGASPFANATYSLGGQDGSAVKPFPDDIATGGLPALVAMDGGMPDIGSGSYEVSKWNVEISVWSEYTPRAERTRQLLGWRESIKAAFRAHARGGLVDPEVSSVLLTGVGAIEGRAWRRAEGAPTYLVMPFNAVLTWRRAVTYQPA